MFLYKCANNQERRRFIFKKCVQCSNLQVKKHSFLWFFSHLNLKQNTELNAHLQ